MFFYFCKVLFSGFLQFQGNFVDGQNNSKYREKSPFDHFSFNTPFLDAIWFLYQELTKLNLVQHPPQPRSQAISVLLPLSVEEGRGEEDREPGNEDLPTRDDVIHDVIHPLKIRISQ